MSTAADSVLVLTSYQQRPRLSGARRVAVSFAASALTRTVLSPLDVLKALVQASPVPLSPAAAARALYASDGVAGFWRGHSAGVAKLLPQIALKYAAFGAIERCSGPLRGARRALAGAAASAAAQLATHPFDVLRARAIADPHRYSGVVRGLAQIAREEGAAGLFRGASTLIGALPYEAVHYAALSALRRAFDGSSPLRECALSTAASLASQTVAYPFDVVRRRLILSADPGVGMVSMFREIVAHEGAKGLYRGIGLSLARAAPYAALQYALIGSLRRAVAVRR